jgi:two-component system, sensor histidine kinase and response regulator
MARILVVDDDPDILETLSYAFAQEGHTVQVESDGLAALAAARRNPPELAVLDVMLPGLNGYEISRLLKDDMQHDRIPRFPILMVTARRVASPERLQFLTAWSRADATLWKPYDLGVLLCHVRAWTTPGEVARPVEEPA